jgi:antitoxin MazE
MKRLIRIGNSQGIRIPKPPLKQTGFRDDMEEAFVAMALQGDDALLDGKDLVPTHWDEEEWEWR